jgi:hypothetical protein
LFNPAQASFVPHSSLRQLGARVISFVKIIDETVYLLSIYNKSEVDNLTDKQIQELIKDYL